MAKPSKAQSSSDNNASNYFDDDQVNDRMNTEPDEEEEHKAVAHTADSGSGSVVEDNVPAAVDGDAHDYGKEDEKMSEIEATSAGKEATSAGKKSGDEQKRQRAYGMSFGSEVNMTNCVKHCQHFFKRFSSIRFEELLAYWMMAGYLGPVSSFDKALKKGIDAIEGLGRILEVSTSLGTRNPQSWFKLPDGLKGLIRVKEILKISPLDMRVGIDKTTGSGIHCRHQGFCILETLGFIDLLDLNFDGGYSNTYADTIVEMRSQRMAYLVDFKPTPKSLTKMFAYQHPEAKNLNVLLIRGCEFLSSGILSHSTNFSSLTVLEISSLPCSPIDIGIISELTRLECLNLSDLPLEMLPDNLFYKLRNLRWLIVRGCSKLCSIPSIDGLTKLVVLDLSHCMSLQEPVFLDIRYPHLQMLDLSYTPIFYGFRELSTPNLTHLSLRGSKLKNLLPFNKLPNLHVPELNSLQVLDLSECEHLVSLLPLMNAPHLEQLNLSGCSCFTQLEEGLLYKMPCLLNLDLSWTKVKYLPSFASLTSLRKLSLRGLELDSIETLASLSSLLVELDLACVKISSSQEFKLDFLQSLKNLQVFNLSHTSVEKLPDMSKLVSLKKLLLADCQQLKVVSHLRDLRNLAELDLTGLKIHSFEELNLDFLQSLKNLQILNLSHSTVEKLPHMSKLQSLKKLLLADCQQLKVVPDLRALTNLETLDLSFPDDSSSGNRQIKFDVESLLSNLLGPLPPSLRRLVVTNRYINKTFENLKHFDPCITDVVDCDRMLQEPKPAEIHVAYGIKSHQTSKVDHLHEVSIELDALILSIQKKFNSSITTIDTNQQAFKMQLEMLHSDMRYIQENIIEIRNSRNWKIREELLQELMDVATDLSTAHLAVDSAAFKQLIRLVVKLKLLVPPKHKDDSYALQITGKKTKKKKKSSLLSNNKENIGIPEFVKEMPGMVSDLLTLYKSLSDIQKQCLLCFSIFPYDEDDKKNTCVLNSLVIRKKILIYWWVGEGFIGSHHEVNVDPSASTDPNKGMMMSTETAAGRDETNEQVFSTKGVKKPKSIEEIGKQIVKVLVEKKFIEPVMRKGQESGSYCMHPFVHSFVIEQAKKEDFLDFSQESCNLIPHFGRSRRACLLKPQDKFPSSCEFWARHVNSPKRLATFENVKTLFNVNDSMIDIKREWFSKMENLYVLRLGSWRSKNADLIEVEDQKFLEDLKRMKQLRLLSLQGLPTIMKLPDSICQLSNLIILDLKECSYLEELPADIGSLKGLTHLDITNCPLLTGLPKGISFLSKLEVLRGFVITDQHVARGSKDRNASILSRWLGKTKWCSTIHNLFHSRNNDVCTLRDLLKLESLKVLSLVVNISIFPSDDELQVFKEMKQLRKLKILWEKSIGTKDNVKSATEQETLTEPSGWQINLKCWEGQPSQHDGDELEEIKHLDNIEKLELWCFPHENTPEWLNPSELKSLKKLYIVGGHLKKLPGLDTGENKWNVETLRLKYLYNLDIEWSDLETMFPQLMYLEKHQCDQLGRFPCDWEGVWRSSR